MTEHNYTPLKVAAVFSAMLLGASHYFGFIGEPPPEPPILPVVERITLGMSLAELEAMGGRGLGANGPEGPQIVAFPSRLSLRNDSVYFSSASQRRIFEVPSLGGVTSTYADEPDLPSAVLADGDAVYWVTDGEGRVMRASTAAPTPTPIAGDLGRATALTGFDSMLFWGTTSGNIGAVDKRGVRTPTTLVADQSFVGFLDTDGVDV